MRPKGSSESLGSVLHVDYSVALVVLYWSDGGIVRSYDVVIHVKV
jgi:hypothetical protein